MTAIDMRSNAGYTPVLRARTVAYRPSINLPRRRRWLFNDCISRSIGILCPGSQM